MSTSQLSFAQTYILASKVRSKLTKEAQSPKSSLRNLVVQANMLDNIMDYISEETTRRTQEYESIRKQKSVEFAPSPLRTNYKTSITEYEIDEDSDDEEYSDDEDMEEEEEEESDDDELLEQPEGEFNGVYYEEEEVSDDDDDSEGSSYYSDEDSDDYYIYSDEEVKQEDVASTIPRTLPITSFSTLPTIDLSLEPIAEEDEEEQELPELAENCSSSEEEEEDLLIVDLNRITLSNSTQNNKKLATGFELSSSQQQQQPISLFRNENISLEHVF
ncbi:hypothetical protein Cantr_01229 [Candida viswanathii]|uniref:Uncharacterized protein n=1 Tax=Candida viswanathii TaxID=5486 RepID=A0A367YHF5_9ASCO|nr:hypothetical protein Cantr_01229 [Candida viswanathii]